MRSTRHLLSFRPEKWLHFINEVHPIFPNIAYSYFSFISFYLFTAQFLKIGSFSWLDIIVGSTTISAVYLGLRALDELKDQETDLFNFPDRPLIKGIVTRSDLISLSCFILIIPLTIHLIIYRFSLPSVSYIAVSAYSLLVYKWFYIKSLLQKNITLAFITHNPLVYILQIYSLSFLITDLKAPFNKQTLALVMTTALMSTAWEVSRKIRQKREENEYDTYTKSWGRSFATYFVVATMSASTIAYLYLLKSPLLSGDTYVVALSVLPLFCLLNLCLQSLKFLKGKIKGNELHKNLELCIAALTCSALALGCLTYIAN